MDFSKYNLSENPFTLKIDPKLFTGYEKQVEAVRRHVDEKHKVALITGPTGSGKTMFLKWFESQLGHSAVYISKPPDKPEFFVDIFTDIFKLSLFERLFGRKPTLHSLPAYITKKMGGKHLTILMDESHETNREVLEWLRVLIDQIESVSLVMAGLPQLESMIREKLETFDQRITTRIYLDSLNYEDTKDLIRKRIAAAGGSGTVPFMESALEEIHRKTGGFPREIIKMCDRMLKTAAEKNLESIEARNVEEFKEFVRLEEPAPSEPSYANEPPSVTFNPRPPTDQQIQNLPSKQKRILEVLSRTDWLTPTAIVGFLEVEKYSSKDHAIRSVNNILHRLMLDGFVQRESRGKAFMYALTPKVRTLMVQK